MFVHADVCSNCIHVGVNAYIWIWGWSKNAYENMQHILLWFTFLLSQKYIFDIDIDIDCDYATQN